MKKVFLLTCIQLFSLFQLSSHTTVKIGVLLMTSASEPFDLRRAGSALSIAFEDVQTEYGITFDVVYHNYTGYCPMETVVGHLSELYYRDNVQAVIGPACSATLTAAGRLAQYLKLPMVTGLGDLVVRDEAKEDMYETLSILSYNLGKLSLSLSAMLKHYNWKHTAILYDQTYVFFDLAGSNLVSDFRENPELARPYDVGFTPSKVPDPGQILQEASAYARDILARADALGMTKGGYVFITMELFPAPDWLGYYTHYLRGDDKDEAVGRAYESLLILTLKQPDNPEYYTFAEEVKRRALSLYNYQFGVDETVNYFITAFYDSAIYLALAYRKCLDAGEDITDGQLVAKKLWNSSFPGITGMVAIDALGNRLADFDLLDMKSATTQEFQMVGRYYGATQEYVVVPGTEIKWPYGKPDDVPRCGFLGDQCKTDEGGQTMLIAGVTISVVCVLGVTGILTFFFIRKMRLEQDLDRKTWLVSSDDIQVRKGRLNDSFLSRSVVSIRTGTQGSHLELPNQVFASTAICKGQTVVVRKLHLNTIELTRNLLMDFREMQRLFNPQLTKFVGACIEPDNNTILFEYCARGSLEDMLQNDSIELDWNFRYSLINDIIKGMVYLHGSKFRCHGRLTSSNCVIDSNFSLKLTDYGLHSLYAKERVEERKLSNTAHFNCRKLLWIAPEHLSTSEKGMGYSQPGDVYSFGIILQEIATRSGPFEDNNLLVEEIMLKLTKSKELIRPVVDPEACSNDLHQLMQDCWHEDTLERPIFHEIQDCFKKMRAGKTTNIMDNLLHRMSQYADNLEVLAAERTRAYLEEKLKAEELLHRLLPSSVARQLETGLGVKPEVYDCVTVYFSDIVGFTALASASTPIQVVDLLNDLYTAFDRKIQLFDVYKVETIGDAYMVVSGLPERNGDLHVKEICDMSLAIITVVKQFKIRHFPEEQLKIRVGVHSGPVVAGVVGLTMPRYCLFGDTVNTASRMESTSEALRIHLSQTSKELLENVSGYSITERGGVTVKGKGNMMTYWLGDNTRDSTV